VQTWQVNRLSLFPVCQKLSKRALFDKITAKIKRCSFFYSHYSPWVVVWRCLRDPMFSHFSKALTCDKQTDGQTHDYSIYHAREIAWRRAVKNVGDYESSLSHGANQFNCYCCNCYDWRTREAYQVGVGARHVDDTAPADWDRVEARSWRTAEHFEHVVSPSKQTLTVDVEQHRPVISHAHHSPLTVLLPLIDWVKVLRPTRHKKGHLGDIPEPIAWFGMEKLKLTQQKHTFTDRNKHTTTQNKHNKLKPHLVASYDIRPGNGDGLFWFWCFINLSFTYLHLPTYSAGTHTSLITALSRLHTRRQHHVNVTVTVTWLSSSRHCHGCHHHRQ